MDLSSKINDLTERLTKLSKLHADGVVSDEEFSALKAKLIARIRDDEAAEQIPSASAKEFYVQQHAVRLLQSGRGGELKKVIVGIFSVGFVIVVGWIYMQLLGSGIDLNGLKVASINLTYKERMCYVEGWCGQNGTAFVDLTNTGDEPITIEEVIVNNKPNCKIPGKNNVLNTGESFSMLRDFIVIGCGTIVKMEVKTNKGLVTFKPAD